VRSATIAGILLAGHARRWSLKHQQRDSTPVLRRPVGLATQSGHSAHFSQRRDKPGG